MAKLYYFQTLTINDVYAIPAIHSSVVNTYRSSHKKYLSIKHTPVFQLPQSPITLQPQNTSNLSYYTMHYCWVCGSNGNVLSDTYEALGSIPLQQSKYVL
jgi:hypothetical protein